MSSRALLRCANNLSKVQLHARSLTTTCIIPRNAPAFVESSAQLPSRRSGTLACVPATHHSQFTFNISPSPRFATSSIGPLNPYNAAPPTDPKISPRVGIFVLVFDRLENEPALLISQSALYDEIPAAQEISQNIQEDLLDGDMNTSDLTIWDVIQRVTSSEAGLTLDKFIGQFNCARHIEMDCGQRVEQTTMNFVVRAAGDTSSILDSHWIWVKNNKLRDSI